MKSRQFVRNGPWVLMVLWVVLSSAVRGEEPAPAEPLHARIDALIEAKRVGPPAALVGDAEFLRRVSLDLTGAPPSVDALRAFLADGSADKRVRAINGLLESPLFARHLATTMDVMLMERRPNTTISADDWMGFLVGAFRENRPLNELMRQILVATGRDAEPRAAARFYLDRGSEPNLITRDVGRMFLGRDLQCAQCHDHPLIDDYFQTDYHGLLAFFNPSYALTRKEEGKDKLYYAEKAGTDLTFDSVFVKNDKHLTGPRLPGMPELAEEATPPGDEYRVRPIGDTLPEPKHSRRARFASLTTAGDYRAFNENLANRLWSVMMGRGLVHPLDLFHPSNPSSHPELTRVLGEALAGLKFDTKAFLRELALTRVYQQSVELPAELAADSDRLTGTLTELKAKTAALSSAADEANTAYRQAVKAWFEAENALIPVANEELQTVAKLNEAIKKRDDAQKAADDAAAALNARRSAAKTLAEAVAKAQEASKSLGQEKELVAAAKVFSDRAEALTKEIAGLEKTSADKAAAVKPTEEPVAAAAKVVEAARAKVAPVRAGVRGKEAAANEARRVSEDRRLAFEQHQKQVLMLESVVRLRGAENASAEARRSLAAAKEAVPAAERAATEYVATVGPKETALKTAEAAAQERVKPRDEARAAVDRERKVFASVETAANAAEAARVQLPGDPTLTEAAAKLKTRTEELRSGLAVVEARAASLAMELDRATAAVEAARKALAEAIAERDRRVAAVEQARKAVGEAEARVEAARGEADSATQQVAESLGNGFFLGRLKPLTPEQLCWSVFQVTGVYDRYHKAEEAELNKAKPLDDKAKADPATLRARAIELEQRTYDKLKGNLGTFVSVYAAGPGQPQSDFFATADQALFTANGGNFNAWINPANGNLADRMGAEKDLRKSADDLYMTVLSRPPTDEEAADVVRLLTEQPRDRPGAVRELIWGLLASAEFRFNH